MYRVVELERVHVYGDSDNFCAEVSVANLGDGELVGVLAQNRGLVHTDTGTIILVRSKDHGKTWDPASKVAVLAEEEDAGWNVAAICRLSDGTLLVHGNRWRYLDHGRIDRQHALDRQGADLEPPPTREPRPDAERARPRCDPRAPERRPADAAPWVSLAAHHA
jgi:hypothetical protein